MRSLAKRGRNVMPINIAAMIRKRIEVFCCFIVEDTPLMIVLGVFIPFLSQGQDSLADRWKYIRVTLTAHHILNSATTAPTTDNSPTINEHQKILERRRIGVLSTCTFKAEEIAAIRTPILIPLTSTSIIRWEEEAPPLPVLTKIPPKKPAAINMGAICLSP